MGRSFTRLFKIISLFIMFTMGTTFVVAQNCNIPTNVSTTNVLNFSATINWDVDTSVNRYRIRYREVGVGSWQYNHNVPSLGFFNLTGLSSSLNYEWQLKAICSSGNLPASGWSSLQTFTTTNYPVDCNNTPNGIAWIDSCGNCVGGTTGSLSCITLLIPFISL